KRSRGRKLWRAGGRSRGRRDVGGVPDCLDRASIRGARGLGQPKPWWMEGFPLYPDRNHLMDLQGSPVEVVIMDLPHHRIAAISSGPGVGGTCDGCEARITKDELMKEVVLAGGRGARGSVQFHTLCFQLSDDERHAATPAV